MVNLIFIEDDVLSQGNAVVRTIYDPAAATGGMLSVAAEHLLQHNPAARLTLFGQELNDESYAICKADMLIRGQHGSRQHAQRRRPRRAQVRLHVVQPAVRRGMEKGRKKPCARSTKKKASMAASGRACRACPTAP
jgi:hypothetical protein